MDQIKIGKFIAEQRKKNNFTQMQLAEKLDITDRAVSKWENGKGMPDSSIMLDLCKELGISVNELLSGEVLEMKDYNEIAEQNLLEMKKQKEQADKRLLNMEFLLGIVTVIMYLVVVAVASMFEMEEWIRLLLIGASTVFVFIICLFLIRIEQVAGYYECQKCHHKYVPTYSSVNLAMHFGRTRYMKCPECGKRSWQKKVISK
jgi:transcriptional regulator with XRE-family HTH domain